ncbi:magnesium transporter CorA [Xylophilus rhododendri]|uniref:Magnesium transporter CorA n=1 Tax=Xylophilus rhododendri TaxID=2697032 RepID=A0A857J1M5_9BURK|nr:transporter [Xylophilus rhododendri]QHI97143.1 magnesium transporter CorA [Xylophilus rhododendri]
MSLSPQQVAAASASDDAGLICGYRFDADADLARPLSLDEATVWLHEATKAAPEDDAFAWLHFNLSNAHAERWIQRHAGLPDAFFDALREDSHSTRIERDDDALVAVLNDVHFDFGFEPSDISTLWICVRPHLVVTARTRPLRSVDALRTALRDGRSPRSTVELLEQLMRTQAASLVDILRGVTRKVDDAEDKLLAGRRASEHGRLGTLRRLLVRLQRLLAPEPAALFRVLHHPPAWMAEDDLQQLRGSTEEFSAVLRDMQGLQERIKLLQEESAAAVNEENNRSLFVLTVVTVLALPINILAGLFGMNVGGIPLAESKHGFWILVSLVIAFTVIAGWLALRKKDR